MRMVPTLIRIISPRINFAHVPSPSVVSGCYYSYLGGGGRLAEINLLHARVARILAAETIIRLPGVQRPPPPSSRVRRTAEIWCGKARE